MNNFILKPNTKVYYPAVSNEIFIAKAVINHPTILKIDELSLYFRTNGKLKEEHISPSLFPAREDWRKILLPVYPNLESPLSSQLKNNRKLIEEILKINKSCLVCRFDNFHSPIYNLILNPNSINVYDFAINPHTLLKINSIKEYFTKTNYDCEFKYCIEVTEYDPKYGYKAGDDKFFDTKKEALDYVNKLNKSSYASGKYVGLKNLEKGKC